MERRFGNLLVLLLLLLSIPDVTLATPTPKVAKKDDAPKTMEKPSIPKGFVRISKFIPDIIIEARYYSKHNFLGRKVKGYHANECILSLPAAKALLKVQKELRKDGHSLKVYDCYRPHMAVSHFVIWARNLRDQKMKSEFYPNIDKKDLFTLGYIAKRSGHSRGSTIDLTIVKLPPKPQPIFTSKTALQSCENPLKNRYADNSLDMGTGYDCFSELSHTLNPKITGTPMKNRLKLKTLMEKHGFENYSKESTSCAQQKSQIYTSTYR